MRIVAVVRYCLNAPKDYLACIKYIQQLVTNGGFELLEEESTCPLNQVKTEDGWADEIWFTWYGANTVDKSLPVLSTLIVVVVLSKRVKVDKYACLSKWFGTFCPVVRRGTRDGGFHIRPVC